MRTTLRWLVISSVLIGAGFLAGTIVGLNVGGDVVGSLRAVSQGVLAVSALKTIESGKTEQTKWLLESDVDEALFHYSVLTERAWYPAYRAGLLPVDPKQYEVFIRRVATYRKSHPSSTKRDMFDKVPKAADPDEFRQLAIGMREYARRVDETVKRYADK
jgi:hypothetical protein